MTAIEKGESRTAGYDFALLVARVLLCLLFIRSGYGKLMDVSAFTGQLAQAGLPAPTILAPIGIAVELLGGIAILVGLKVRLSSALLIVFTIGATAIAHRYWEFPAEQQQLQSIMFLKNLGLIGGFLALYVCGAGRYSVDGVMRR